MKKSILLFTFNLLFFLIGPHILTEGQSWSCGDSFTIDHIEGTVAPVTKTVTYGTVSDIPGEPSKCWITSNLGADRQATAVNDDTEASAGWYWQFNRMQGYKHDGQTRTPNTTWITEINENFDWQADNDPCALELGGGWRIPTLSEWSNVDESGNWDDWDGPWNSALKMHAAGLVQNLDGSLAARGLAGYYWSSIHSTDAQGWDLYFYNGVCYMNDYAWKPYALTIRCIENEGQSWSCGDSMTIDHLEGNVAPVTKTVTYGTAADIPGEPSKCWITSNLGADHQAMAVNDATEASAGWYWQFNRMQGYKHDGQTRTPNTPWITNIIENSDWQAANDPCALELSNSWRLPTVTEWSNVSINGGWINWVGPWNSSLKIHAAGHLLDSDGDLTDRGDWGFYWSSTQRYDHTNGYYLRFTDDYCGNGYNHNSKAYGFSVRCLHDENQVLPPEICIVTVTHDEHNQVIWEKQPFEEIELFQIYRETTQTDVYEVIGSVAYEDSSIFTDLTSNPQQRPYKYKISAVSENGNESALSDYHRTIHLTINEGPTGWNLIWSPYEGFPVGTYYIYRSAYPDSLTILDSISGSFTSYTDINPPWGPLYYAIEVVNPEGCFPGKDVDYDKSRSNVQFNGEVGITDDPEACIRIYPNPAKDKLFIQLEEKGLWEDSEIIISDIEGTVKISKRITTEKSSIDISGFSPGVYVIRISYDRAWLTRKLIVF